MPPKLDSPFATSRTASPVPSQHRKDAHHSSDKPSSVPMGGPSGSRAPSVAPSRASSYKAPTPSLFPINPSAAQSSTSMKSSASTLSPEDQTHGHHGISHRLKHMFDHTKTANFEAKVMIHELGNVPQLAGEFAVTWKFRGRRPRGKDAAYPHGPKSKPSLPNLKLNQPSQAARSLEPSPSSSTLSLNSNSTSSSPITSTHASSVRSMQIPSTSARSSTPTLTKKSSSLPLNNLTPIIPTRQPSAPISQKTADPPPPRHQSNSLPPRIDKKTSDPTPLRQSTGPSGEISASPERMPLEEHSSSDLLHPDRARDIAGGSSPADSSASSGVVAESPISLLPPAVLAAQSSPNSASSSTSHLLFPGARSGSGPSPATILDPVPGKGEDPLVRPRPLHRSTSHGSSPTINTNPTMGDGTLSRHRSASGASAPTRNQPSQASTRKGTTPSSSLRSHTATWNYELSHTLKIPLGKPIPIMSNGTGNSGSATPRIRGNAPVVGAGPFSDSGLHLVIEQLPSKAAMSTPVTEDKEGLHHTLHAAHRAKKDDGKNPTEKGGGAETQKTVFGVVDIDLAAFAGRGKMTRRFLLRGSRTNAVIKLSVEMRWVGGEEHWAAPPIQEGHHVTGMRDLVGADTEEKIKSDLNLAKTPSNSSSTSSISAQSLAQSRAHPSGSSTHNLHATMSNVSLVGSAPPVAYKSYEHHLRPAPESQPDTPPPRGSSSTLDIVRRHTHRHRTHHSRHFREPPAIQQFSMHDLSPDVVIEAVFNPHAAMEDGPFTFVPVREGGERVEPGKGMGLEGEEKVLQRMFSGLMGDGQGAGEGPSGAGEGDGKAIESSGGGGKWGGLRGMRGRKGAEKRERTVSGLTFTSMTWGSERDRDRDREEASTGGGDGAGQRTPTTLTA